MPLCLRIWVWVGSALLPAWQLCWRRRGGTRGPARASPTNHTQTVCSCISLGSAPSGSGGDGSTATSRVVVCRWVGVGRRQTGAGSGRCSGWRCHATRVRRSACCGTPVSRRLAGLVGHIRYRRVGWRRGVHLASAQRPSPPQPTQAPPESHTHQIHRNKQMPHFRAGHCEGACFSFAAHSAHKHACVWYASSARPSSPMPESQAPIPGRPSPRAWANSTFLRALC